MIDYLYKFANEADAKASPVAGAYWKDDGSGGGAWDTSCCIPGVAVWQPSADTTETITEPNGQPVEQTTHHPLPYWYILIAKPTVELDLFNAALLTTDRTRAQEGQPFVLGSVLSDADLATYVLAPGFAGSSYPFGNPR